MSSKYIQAPDFDYWFKSEPRELSVYDSLAWAANFGHTVEGQAGIVFRTLEDEVRRLNRVIHERKLSDAANITTQPATSRSRDSTDIQSAIGSIKAPGDSYQGTS